MTDGNRLPLVAGAALFAVGLAVAADRGLTAVLSLEWLVDALGHDYFVAAAMGAVALAGGLAVVGARTVRGFDQATPPTAESVPAGRPLGEELDRVVEEDLGPIEHLRGERRRDVRNRLRRTAIATVARVDRCPRREARERVTSGAWTDDEVAAAFLAPDSSGAPLSVRAVDALPGESQFQARARRTAREIVELDGRAEP